MSPLPFARRGFLLLLVITIAATIFLAWDSLILIPYSDHTGTYYKPARAYFEFLSTKRHSVRVLTRRFSWLPITEFRVEASRPDGYERTHAFDGEERVLQAIEMEYLEYEWGGEGTLHDVTIWPAWILAMKLGWMETP